MHHFHRLNSQRGIYPVAATIEDSTEEFLTASSREGSFGHPSTRRYSTGGGLVCPHYNNMEGERSNHDEVSPMDGGITAGNQTPLRATSRSQRRTTSTSQCSASPAELGPVPRQSSLADRQTDIAVQPDASPRHKPALKMERILMAANRVVSLLCQATAKRIPSCRGVNSGAPVMVMHSSDPLILRRMS
jgi:hypothetical protein